MNIIYVDDEKIQLENFRLTAKGLKGMENLQLFGSSQKALKWAKVHPVDIASEPENVFPENGDCLDLAA